MPRGITVKWDTAGAKGKVHMTCNNRLDPKRGGPMCGPYGKVHAIAAIGGG